MVFKRVGNNIADSVIDSLNELKIVDSSVQEIISTGIDTLDLALRGGLASGIVELYGLEGTGKSTLAIQICKELQNKGIVLYFDYDNALNPEYIFNLGVNGNNFLVAKPHTLEDGYGILCNLIGKVNLSCIVIDSLVSAVSRNEFKGNIAIRDIGSQARVFSKILRGLVARVREKNILLIIINQLRQSFGTFFEFYFTPGGMALKFYSLIRIKLKLKELSQEGVLIKAVITKNRIGFPHGICSLYLKFGKGFDSERSLIIEAIERKILTKMANDFEFCGFKGSLNEMLEKLKNDKIYKELLIEAIRSKICSSSLY